MAILRNTIISLLPLLLTGCETDFHPKTDIEPVLCLNSLITAGEPINVRVTHTWVYTDEYAAKNHEVRDAIVRIFANGIETERDYLPKEGDRIRIEATSATYGNADAEVTVPYATVPEDLDYSAKVRSISTDQRPDWGISGRMLFDITVSTDIPACKENDSYYRLTTYPFPSGKSTVTYSDGILYPEEEYKQVPNQTFSKGRFVATDPIFSEYISDFEEITGLSGLDDESAFFSDRGFDAPYRKVFFRLEGCGFSVYGLKPDEKIIDCGYRVTLYSISDSYFNWAVYYWQWAEGLIGEFGQIGLADPIWGYSNVSTGAGVVAAQSSATLTLNLRDFLEKTITSNVKRPT